LSSLGPRGRRDMAENAREMETTSKPGFFISRVAEVFAVDLLENLLLKNGGGGHGHRTHLPNYKGVLIEMGMCLGFWKRRRRWGSSSWGLTRVWKCRKRNEHQKLLAGMTVRPSPGLLFEEFSRVQV